LTAATFEGSASRRMVAPFVLSPGINVELSPIAALVGPYVDSEGAPDILAITGSNAPSAQALGWLVPSQGGSGDLDAAAVTYHEFMSEMLFFCAHWVTANFYGDDDRWEAIAIDEPCIDGSDKWRMATARPMEGDGGTILAFMDLTEDPPPDFRLRPRTMSVCDLESDGRPDLLALTRPPGASAFEIGVFKNHGEFLSTLPELLAENSSAGENVIAFAHGNLNSDGFPDLIQIAASKDNRDPKIILLLSTGPGQYGPPLDLAELADARFLAAGDVNGDGLDDVLVLTGQHFQLFLNTALPVLGNREE
jgi:hypothetical protein